MFKILYTSTEVCTKDIRFQFRLILPIEISGLMINSLIINQSKKIGGFFFNFQKNNVPDDKKHVHETNSDTIFED